MGVSLQKGNKLGAFFVSQSLPLLYMASVNDSWAYGLFFNPQIPLVVWPALISHHLESHTFWWVFSQMMDEFILFWELSVIDHTNWSFWKAVSCLGMKFTGLQLCNCQVWCSHHAKNLAVSGCKSSRELFSIYHSLCSAVNSTLTPLLSIFVIFMSTIVHKQAYIYMKWALSLSCINPHCAYMHVYVWKGPADQFFQPFHQYIYLSYSVLAFICANLIERAG